MATERTTASNPAQRRRRGIVSRSMQARVAPEPAAYQGVLPEGWCWEGVRRGWVKCGGVVWEGLTVKGGGKPLVEGVVTGVTENGGGKGPRGVFSAVRLSGPVNPVNG